MNLDNRLPQESFIKDFLPAHQTGGNIYNDIIVLKNGMVIRIGESGLGISKTEGDDEYGICIASVELDEAISTEPVIKSFVPDKISNFRDAAIWLTELFRNGEDYHPEDSANTVIIRGGGRLFNDEEAARVQKAMDDIYDLPGVPFETFDPCEHGLLLRNMEPRPVFPSKVGQIVRLIRPVNGHNTENLYMVREATIPVDPALPLRPTVNVVSYRNMLPHDEVFVFHVNELMVVAED